MKNTTHILTHIVHYISKYNVICTCFFCNETHIRYFIDYVLDLDISHCTLYMIYYTDYTLCIIQYLLFFKTILIFNSIHYMLQWFTIYIYNGHIFGFMGANLSTIASPPTNQHLPTASGLVWRNCLGSSRGGHRHQSGKFSRLDGNPKGPPLAARK